MTRLGLVASLLALPALAVEPTWAHAVDVAGRAFVADKSLRIASDAVKPSTTPTAKAPALVGRWVESNLQDKAHETVAFGALEKAGAHYRAGNGMQLGADYVDFLAQRVGKRQLSFAFRGSCQPVVVVARGTAVGLLLPLSVPGSAVDAPPEPEWLGVARLADGTRFLLDASFVFSEAQLGQMPASNAHLRALPPNDTAAVESWMATRVKRPVHLSDLRCGKAPGTYEGPGGVLLNARYVDYLRARVDLWPLELHAKAPLEPVALVLKGRPAGVLMPMKP